MIAQCNFNIYIFCVRYPVPRCLWIITRSDRSGNISQKSTVLNIRLRHINLLYINMI